MFSRAMNANASRDYELEDDGQLLRNASTKMERFLSAKSEASINLMTLVGN
jgi:hypothetical protein